MVPGREGMGEGPEMFDGEEFGGLGVWQADDVGGARAGLQRGFVDIFFVTFEMPGCVHVGAAVGVKMEHFGVPTIAGHGAVLFKRDLGDFFSDGAG